MAENRHHPPIGQHKPKPYRVVVADTFKQYRFTMAALVIRNGWTVPRFLLYCADYVLAHHPELKHLRAVFRTGERDILAAARSPVGPEVLEPESERERRRQRAFERFATWAESELHEDITREGRGAGGRSHG